MSMWRHPSGQSSGNVDDTVFIGCYAVILVVIFSLAFIGIVWVLYVLASRIVQ